MHGAFYSALATSSEFPTDCTHTHTPLTPLFSLTTLFHPAQALGEVELSKVHFTYPARPEVEVLKGLSVNVQQGKTLALVGPSGCGKSTVVSLIERFYDPSLEEGGKIELDSRELRELNVKWLRSKIGLVSQEPVLFDGSIADNIRYGDLSREISDEEVEAAATAANIHDFIMSQPMVRSLLGFTEVY